MSSNVTVAVSMGDPTGIGPEVIVKALTRPPPRAHFRVYGCLEVIERAASVLGLPLPSTRVEWVELAGPSQQAGPLQVAAIERALEAVVSGGADALCTAPISKAAAASAGFAFAGHTEFLADRAGVRRYAMMLAGPRLRVVPLTGHVALDAVSALLTPASVSETLTLTVEALRDDFGVGRPRVALTGLNPHAGEQGVIGDAEQRVLGPALERVREQLRRDGVDAELVGPLAADGLFAMVDDAGFDAVVCCYHDQALIPFKMRHRDDGVNVTLGLPFVRTSPAHGTAHDIAGRGVAHAGSMRAALALAVEMTLRRRRGAGSGVAFDSSPEF